MAIDDFNALFRRYARDLTRFLARRVPSPDMAADIAQEAFLKVMQVPAASIADTRAYLFRTAANLAINQNRRQRVLPMVADSEAELAVLADLAPLPDRVVAGRLELAVLMKAIATLPPRRQEVFRIHAVMHLDSPEIARRLGISRNMVDRHLRKALEHCLQYMSQPEDME